MSREPLSRLLKRFDSLAPRFPAWAIIVLVWAIFVFPAISLRAFHYEEGYVVGIARSAIEDSIWLNPHLYGWRFVERPHLMAWVVAVIGLVFGGVNQWVARAPAVLSLLGGCLLIHALVRRYAGAAAALFAAGCLLVSPMMLQKIVTAEPDIMVAVILFGAFIVWWYGTEQGGVSLLRWLAIGCLLTLAALVKGPQPLAYFLMGIAAFDLMRRRWLDLAGLCLAAAMAGLVSLAWYWWVYEPGDMNQWTSHSRLQNLPTTVFAWMAMSLRFIALLAVEHLPALILVIPLGLALARDRSSRQKSSRQETSRQETSHQETSHRDELAIALLLYAACCTVVLAFWPNAAVRHAMPATLAVAAAAGLAFERFRAIWPRLANLALAVGALLGAYHLILSWVVMPGMPERFQQTRNRAFVLSQIIATRPAPLYVPAEGFNKNLIAYLREPFRVVRLDQVRGVEPPAWVLTTPQHAEQLRQWRPDLRIEARATVALDGGYQLLELNGK